MGLLEIMKLVAKTTVAGFITGSFMPNIFLKNLILQINILDCKNYGFFFGSKCKKTVVESISKAESKSKCFINVSERQLNKIEIGNLDKCLNFSTILKTLQKCIL